MDVQEYNQLIGAIVTNLQALESVLRYYSIRNKAKEIELPKVGTVETTENALTSNAVLGTLVDKFNNSLTAKEQESKIDRQVVKIRDVIAYGRLLASEQQPPFRLWKFGRPKNGRVPVEFCHDLNEEWLTVTNNMIDAQRQKAVDCFIARGYKGLR
jgi:hypothetical protein